MKYLIFLLVLLGCVTPYSVDNSGLVHYAVPTSVSYSIGESQTLENVENVTRQRITVLGKDTVLSAYVYMPLHPKAALLWLPPAGKSKDDIPDRWHAFTELGLAVLIPDIRGLGESTGKTKTLEEDIALFVQGKEPMHHLLVYDALEELAVLQEMSYSCIILGGESNGGRIATVAAAQPIVVKGLLLMSTGGYGHIEHPFYEVRRFFTSMNPETYAPLLTIPVAVIHDTEDPTIPYAFGLRLYGNISSSKQLFTLSKRCHGYCPAMNIVLKESIDYLLNQC